MTPATGNDGLVARGTVVPSIELPRLGAPGEPVPLVRTGAPGPTLAVFFKESCPTCRFALPFLERLHRQVAPRGGRVVAVSQNAPGQTEAFRDDLDLTMPILIDAPDLEMSRWFDLVSVPTLYLFDESGAIRSGLMGFNKRDLETMAGDLAASSGAPKPSLWNAGEQIPESRPG